MMSSFSLTSSPTRCIGWPQSAFGQVVSAGSWWCSTRCRCSGSFWRRGRRAASLGTTGACGSCRLQRRQLRLQAGFVLGQGLGNSARCCAVMASLLAPNFQRFRRASSKVSFSSFASRQTISRPLRSISPMVPAPAGPHHWRKHRCQQQHHQLHRNRRHHHHHPHDFRHG
jgi:hypothetical protein